MLHALRLGESVLDEFSVQHGRNKNTGRFDNPLKKNHRAQSGADLDSGSAQNV